VRPLRVGGTARETTVRAREATVRAREATVRAREATVRAREATVTAREATVRAREATVRAREITVRVSAWVDRAFACRVCAFACRVCALACRVCALACRVCALACRDCALACRVCALACRDCALACRIVPPRGGGRGDPPGLPLATARLAQRPSRSSVSAASILVSTMTCSSSNLPPPPAFPSFLPFLRFYSVPPCSEIERAPPTVARPATFKSDRRPERWSKRLHLAVTLRTSAACRRSPVLREKGGFPGGRWRCEASREFRAKNAKLAKVDAIGLPCWLGRRRRACGMGAAVLLGQGGAS
jgi:hypothetical protein